jgi:hypothetical protein
MKGYRPQISGEQKLSADDADGRRLKTDSENLRESAKSADSRVLGDCK